MTHYGGGARNQSSRQFNLRLAVQFQARLDSKRGAAFTRFIRSNNGTCHVGEQNASGRTKADFELANDQVFQVFANWHGEGNESAVRLLAHDSGPC
jgi:hypothetical protein